MTKVLYGTHKKYHFIYKTTNILSGKYYIGMHSTDNLDDGYLGSGKLLKRSINKHGRENHKIEILEYLTSRDALMKREAEIVNLQEIAKKECMNLRVGGFGGYCEASVIYMKAKWRDPAFRKIYSDLRLDQVWLDKLKTNIKIGLKRVNHNHATFKGKKHTNDTIQKMKNTAKLNGNQIGDKNSQFGTMWITNDIENKKIKKDLFEHWVNLGWSKGRKMIINQ